jgi:hypothetical protein
MPSGALHRTVYMSSSVGVLRAQEPDRIYLRAKSANSRQGITGLMLFHEGVFLQVLEGPAAGLTRLMEKIQRDRRHANPVVLESAALEARNFHRSPLAFIAARGLSAGEKQAFSELRQEGAARPGAFPAGRGLSDFLAAFAAAEPAGSAFCLLRFQRRNLLVQIADALGQDRDLRLVVGALCKGEFLLETGTVAAEAADGGLFRHGGLITGLEKFSMPPE